MWNLVFSGLMVGLPAGAGVYMIVNRPEHERPTIGFMLLIYSATIVLLFSLFMPEGKLFVVNNRIKMPGIFIAGCVIGAIAGLIGRARAKKLK